MAGPVRFNTKKITLYRWKWTGKNSRGQKLSGHVVAGERGEVEQMLRGQRIMISALRRKGKVGRGLGRINSRDIMLFSRQMATMIRAGLPVLQAFEVVAESIRKPAMSAMVQQLLNDVAAGSSFAEALAKHPREFDSLFISLIQAGEQSGTLDRMLERVATYKEKTEALKAKIKKAMNYPIAVVAVAIIVSAILLIKVVPQFEQVFANFGAELPAFTLMVIGISQFLQEWWFIFLIAIIAAAFAFKEAMKRSQKLRDSVDRGVLKLPIIGDILYKSAVARFARTLSTTFAAGVPLVDALDSVSGATGNVVFKNATNKIKADVSTGMQLNFSMRTTGTFPSMAVQMTAIGEESGSLDEMLDKVASFYEAEVDNMVDGLTSLMEPIIMSVLGVLIGGLIIAMYLPIFQLGAVV